MYYDLFIFAIPILDMKFIIRSYFYRIHVIRRKQAQRPQIHNSVERIKQHNTARLLRSSLLQ